jgi:hypothetical protein
VVWCVGAVTRTREHYQGPVMELYDQITMSHPLDVLTLLKKKS